MEIVKGIFSIGILLLIVNWIFGIAVTVCVFGVGLILYFVLEYVEDKQREKSHKEYLEKQKARKEMLESMTKEERREFAEKERAEREKQEREQAQRDQEQKIRRQRNLEKRKQDLRERELAVREKAAAEAEKGKKVPLAVKTAIVGVVGYKLGKKIAKW